MPDRKDTPNLLLQDLIGPIKYEEKLFLVEGSSAYPGQVAGHFVQRLIHPMVVHPAKVDSPEAYLWFSKPEKTNKHGKTVTAHAESKVN